MCLKILFQVVRFHTVNIQLIGRLRYTRFHVAACNLVVPYNFKSPKLANFFFVVILAPIVNCWLRIDRGRIQAQCTSYKIKKNIKKYANL